MTRKTTHDNESIFVGSSAISILLGTFGGGYMLKILLEYLGFKNNGDCAIPVLIYTIILVLVSIFIVPRYAIKWCQEDDESE